MASNLDRYKKDLDALVDTGARLLLAMKAECDPDGFDSALEAKLGEKTGEKGAAIRAALPVVADSYQAWYSEALVLLKQLLPDRVQDFVRHYEKPKGRKEITLENYKIEDYLQGLSITRTYSKETVVGPGAAISQLRQQVGILKSVKARFESSLFEIRQLMQADLFDSELDAAKELAKNKFTRAAGVLAGVVLERHLGQVCQNHSVKLKKKEPTIGDLNDALKDAGVIDVAQWRFVQHLGDIRNLCSHNKKVDPTAEQVEDLISGVVKTTKTLH